jgi:hypothetical protein
MESRYLYAIVAGTLVLGAAAYGISEAGVPSRSLMSPVDYRGARNVIESQARATRALCQQRTGQAGDVCRVEAREIERMARADLEAEYRGTVAAAGEARLTRAKSRYLIASARCQGSQERAACLRSAREDKAEAIDKAKVAAS